MMPPVKSNFNQCLITELQNNVAADIRFCRSTFADWYLCCWECGALAYKLKPTEFYKKRSGLTAYSRDRAPLETSLPLGRSFNLPIVRQPTRTDLNAPCSECGDSMHLEMIASASGAGEPDMTEHIFVCSGCNAVDVFAFPKAKAN